MQESWSLENGKSIQSLCVPHLPSAGLRKNQVIVFPTTVLLPEPDEPDVPAFLLDEDIGWLLGMYVAEGWIQDDAIYFSGHRREVERFERIGRIAKALGAGFLNSCELIICAWNKGHTWNFTRQKDMHNFIESPIFMGREGKKPGSSHAKAR